MPRDGSGRYSLPPNTAAVPNQTAASAKINLVHSDFEDDANAARPIPAGGTGGTNEEEARENLGVDPAVVYSPKSGSYTALAADNNAIIRFSASATLSLTAAGTLGSGWHAMIIAGGGAVTIDPNGSETINGAATLVLSQDTATTIVCDGSNFFTAALSSATTPITPSSVPNYLSGLVLSNNGSDATNDIDIATGGCLDSTNAYSIVLASALTKRLDAGWAVGTNQGGLDTGSIANTTYHVFAIKRLDTGVVDVLFSTSVSSPTMPANYTVRRRIGSIIRAGGTIRAFSQFGDEFLLQTPVLDVDTDQAATAVSRTLSVPTGIRVWAKFRMRGSHDSLAWGILASSLDTLDIDPTLAGAPLVSIAAPSGNGDRDDLTIRTNTSAQVRTRATVSGTIIQIVSYGWTDARGK